MVHPKKTNDLPMSNKIIHDLGVHRDKKQSWIVKMIAKLDLIHESKPELYSRIVSGLIMSVLMIVFIVRGGFLFNMSMILMVAFSVMEFSRMIFAKCKREAISHEEEEVSYLNKLMIAYCSVPAISCIAIRESAQGRSITIWLFLTIWSVDTIAYIVGKMFGKNKLYPKISPTKTIEGAVAGVLAGVLVSMITYPIMISIYDKRHPDLYGLNFYSMIILAVLISFLAILGDLFESYIKRLCGVKDSGTLIAGHGGVMDRVDSLTFAAPVVAIIVAIKKGVFF